MGQADRDLSRRVCVHHPRSVADMVRLDHGGSEKAKALLGTEVDQIRTGLRRLAAAVVRDRGAGTFPPTLNDANFVTTVIEHEIVADAVFSNRGGNDKDTSNEHVESERRFRSKLRWFFSTRCSPQEPRCTRGRTSQTTKSRMSREHGLLFVLYCFRSSERVSLAPTCCLMPLLSIHG